MHEEYRVEMKRSRGCGALNILVTCDMKYRHFALASSQTFSAGRKEILESREEVNDEKKASGGEKRRKVVENNGGERK